MLPKRCVRTVVVKLELTDFNAYMYQCRYNRSTVWTVPVAECVEISVVKSMMTEVEMLTELFSWM